jgi:hypothetical protein
MNQHGKPEAYRKDCGKPQTYFLCKPLAELD